MTTHKCMTEHGYPISQSQNNKIGNQSETLKKKEKMKDHLRDFTSVGTAGLGVAVLASDSDILADSLADLVKVDERRGDNNLCCWGWEGEHENRLRLWYASYRADSYPKRLEKCGGTQVENPTETRKKEYIVHTYRRCCRDRPG